MKDRLGKEEQYSEEDIIKEFSNFFMAGTDTTSNYLQGMIYLIAQHPEVEKKLRKEINERMTEEDYSFDNLKNFHYIDWIQKETTRFFGPSVFLFIREASKDHYFKGIQIPKGSQVNLTVSSHFDSKNFKDLLYSDLNDRKANVLTCLLTCIWDSAVDQEPALGNSWLYYNQRLALLNS